MPEYNNLLPTREDIINLLKTNIDTISVDFNTLLGDTIKERYEALYLKILELTRTIFKNGAVGYAWIISSPEITSIIETSTANFVPISSDRFTPNRFTYEATQIPFDNELYEVGILSNRWKVIVDPIMTNTMLIGIGDKEPDNCKKLILENFYL